MSVENCVSSIEGGYLHFNRVDSYKDFPHADRHDGEQLPGDRAGNAAATFEKAPTFSAADYYDRSRSRTYAPAPRSKTPMTSGPTVAAQPGATSAWCSISTGSGPL